jgi:hypothetical protein
MHKHRQLLNLVHGHIGLHGFKVLREQLNEAIDIC